MPENAPAGENSPPAIDDIVTAVMAKLGTDLDRKIGGAVAGQLKKLDLGKVVSDAMAEFETKKSETASAGTQQAGTQDSKVDPELVKLRRTVEDQGKALAKEQKAREDAENRARSQSADTAIRGALTKAGLRPEAIDRLAKSYRADVTFDESGEPMLPVEGGTSTIAAAIEADIKSKALDFAMPPPNAGGSGSSKPRVNGAGVNLDALATKPREQWTDAEKDAHFQRQVAANTAAGV